MHPALRAALTGDGDMDESDSEEAVAEIRNSPQVRPPRRNSGESSSSRGSSTERKLLSSRSSTPSHPLTPTRSTSSESSTPIRQGSSPVGKESSNV